MTVPIGTIMAATCQRFAVSPVELTGPSRKQPIFRARAAAMYVMRVTGQMSYPQIARRFGQRDHTTVMNAVRKVPEMMGTDADYQLHVVAIISAVIARQVRDAEAARGGVFRSVRARAPSDRPTRTDSDGRTELTA